MRGGDREAEMVAMEERLGGFDAAHTAARWHGLLLRGELAVLELSGNGAGILAAANTVISTFLLVFVAEWGDKSFFSTIEPYGD
ncbi:hypothetical protein F0562_018638 [Nyssa sinensis]|uniref:Uncharacterized protein n=1 Tax=Nyssa sinensis TaxID=561372 RepID=A0A5J4ZEK8_9ASTE|nr:hypothetical protein F0562_018638 [Nyssa sinensis]